MCTALGLVCFGPKADITSLIAYSPSLDEFGLKALELVVGYRPRFM